MKTSIVVPKTDPCAFCDYLRGERPYTVLYRSDTVAALVTREQRGIGHTLVIPVRHVPTVVELARSERHAIADLVASIAEAIDTVYERPGIAIWQNNGVSAHQAIPHVHVHVAGTLRAGGTDFGNVPEIGVEETGVIGRQLAAVLRPDRA